MNSIRELEAERGIFASARTESYGCVFGRDSLITSRALLRAYRRTRDPYLLDLVGKILDNLADLQGVEINIESGEEPGKCIHEFRPDNHTHLTASSDPWYVYPDLSMRNYDSVDATPLFLIALQEYLLERYSSAASEKLMGAARRALEWLLVYADSNGDGFIDYQFHPDRIHGGLRVQSWMDSSESVFFERDNTQPQYPIAPVEVQAYAYTALRLWAGYLGASDVAYARSLDERADSLKWRFNRDFVIERERYVTLASAIDGAGRKLTSVRSSMAHCLWAVARQPDGEPDSILESRHVPSLVRRLLAADLYVPKAGMRTLSSRSSRYDPQSYHNGTIWPHDTAIVAEGLENFGYAEEARRVRQSLLRSYAHFKTPVELFAYRRGLREYAPVSGGAACRTQAWSAASILSTLADHGEVPILPSS